MCVYFSEVLGVKEREEKGKKGEGLAVCVIPT